MAVELVLALLRLGLIKHVIQDQLQNLAENSYLLNSSGIANYIRLRKDSAFSEKVNSLENQIQNKFF